MTTKIKPRTKKNALKSAYKGIKSAPAVEEVPARGYPYRVRKLTAKGLGKPWMAECHRPWKAGDVGCASYIYGEDRGTHSCFYLKPRTIYICGEPFWKRPVDDDIILAEDDQIDVRLFYVIADGGMILGVSDEFAGELLLAKQ